MRAPNTFRALVVSGLASQSWAQAPEYGYVHHDSHFFTSPANSLPEISTTAPLALRSPKLVTQAESPTAPQVLPPAFLKAPPLSSSLLPQAAQPILRTTALATLLVTLQTAATPMGLGLMIMVSPTAVSLVV